MEEKYYEKYYDTIRGKEYQGATHEPGATKPPRMIEEIKSTELPSALEGFRAGLRKREDEE